MQCISCFNKLTREDLLVSKILVRHVCEKCFYGNCSNKILEKEFGNISGIGLGIKSWLGCGINARDNLKWQSKMYRNGILKKIKKNYLDVNFYSDKNIKCPDPILKFSKKRVNIYL